MDPELVGLFSNYIANVAADATRAGASRLARALGRETPEAESSRSSLNASLQAALVDTGVQGAAAERVARYLLWEADLVHFVKLASAEGSSEDYEGATFDELRAHLRIEVGLEDEEADVVATTVADLIRQRQQTYSRPLLAGPETSAQLLLAQRSARARMFQELGVPSLEQLLDYTQRYLRSATHDFRTVRLQQLGSQGTEVALDDVFVPPYFSGSRDGDELFDTDDTLARNQRIVILGAAGSGKSTSVRAAAGSLAARADPRVVPFVLEMRKFLAQTALKSEMFVAHLEQRVATTLQEAPPPGWINYLLISGRAIVFFDGFDEVLDAGRRSEIRDAVRNFATLFPGCSIVATSRFTGYELAPFSETEFTHVRICELTEPQVALYASKWFSLRGIGPGDAELSPQYFLKESKEYADDIRRNPLMLSLLCSVFYSRGDIPKSLSELYEQCAGLLYEQWNTMRGIADHGAWSKKLRPALYEVANLVLNSDEYLSEGIPEADLIRSLRRYFIDSLNLDPVDAGRAARDLADIWAGRAWVLTAVSSDALNRPRYGFVHQSFLEYFAAVYIFREARDAQDLLRRLRRRLIYMNGWSVALLAVSTFESWRSSGGSKFVDALVKDAGRSVASEQLALLRFAVALNEVVPITGATRKRVIGAILQTYSSAVVIPETVSTLWDAHEETRSRHFAFRQRVTVDSTNIDDIEFDLDLDVEVQDLPPEERKYDGPLSTLDAEAAMLSIVDWSTTDARITQVFANCLDELASSGGVDRACATGMFLIEALDRVGVAGAPVQTSIGALALATPTKATWFGIACARAGDSVTDTDALRLLPWRSLALNETLVQSYVLALQSRPLIVGELTSLLTEAKHRRWLASVSEKIANELSADPPDASRLDIRARDGLTLTPPLEPVSQDCPYQFTDSTVVASVALVQLVREVWGEEWLAPLADLELDFASEELLEAAIGGTALPERSRKAFGAREVRVLEMLMSNGSPPSPPSD